MGKIRRKLQTFFKVLLKEFLLQPALQKVADWVFAMLLSWVITYYTNLDIEKRIWAGLTLVLVTLIILLWIQHTRRRRNEDALRLIRKARAKKILAITDTLSDIADYQSKVLTDMTIEPLSQQEIKDIDRALFADLRLKVFPYNSHKPIEQVIKEQALLNIKHKGLSLKRFTDNDIAFMKNIAHSLSAQNRGLLPMLNKEDYRRLLDLLDRQAGNISVTTGIEVYKHLHMLTGINNYVVFYYMNPPSYRKLIDRFNSFKWSEFDELKRQTHTTSLEQLREKIDAELLYEY